MSMSIFRASTPTVTHSCLLYTYLSSPPHKYCIGILLQGQARGHSLCGAIGGNVVVMGPVFVAYCFKADKNDVRNCIAFLGAGSISRPLYRIKYPRVPKSDLPYLWLPIAHQIVPVVDTCCSTHNNVDGDQIHIYHHILPAERRNWTALEVSSA